MSRKKDQIQEPRQSDTSKVLSISDLADNAREAAFRTEIVRLEALNVGLSQTIDQMIKSLEYKEHEIAHLKNLLMGSTPVIGEVSKIMISDEEAICDLQIKKLKEATHFREMTLDEVKRLDLLIKNKRLAQGNATTIEQKPKGLPQGLSNQELLTIAAKPIKEEE